METASCLILDSLRLSRISHGINNKCYNDTPRNNLNLVTPSFSTPPRFPDFTKCLRFNRLPALSSPSSPHYQNTSQELAVLLEVEGVLLDSYRVGNRQAFNAAFKKLGLDCAKWTEPIYLDLLRKGASDEERMLILYFNRIGWPTSLPTSEKETFVKSVLQEKKKALNEFVMSRSVPLRPGVEDFIEDAYKEGIPVIILTAYSRSGDYIARTIVEKLGSDQISKVMIVGNKEVEHSLYGKVVSGTGLSSGVDEQLSREAKKAASVQKQKIAEEVASMLKLTVEIDTGLSESLDKIVAALRAGAEYAGIPFNNCVLIAGSQPGVAGAQQVGMPCVVLRSSLTSRAEFPSANAIMEGFGGADLTISRLRSLSQKKWS
ncbi:Haloacid dehalogenase-like hydrolase domain-containing protein [Quillaja saponaria]|uniref:Haloacid dehalogenase-like hydrolase domain-containing protein n=1 Tax=Quillaja saponaria TaxID=32244 RepID=A0AAD7M3E2_QUISA|nr:Haloacid dehalogenase-like hydrolase domain-containing protein [Quillaja saponaria]